MNKLLKHLLSLGVVVKRFFISVYDSERWDYFADYFELVLWFLTGLLSCVLIWRCVKLILRIT